MADENDGIIDHGKELEDMLASLSESPELEAVVSEIGALHSIYDDGSIRVWKPEVSQDRLQGTSQSRLIRYEVHVDMPPPHDSHELRLRILVSLPYTYPESSPPQLQLLNRYIGSYKVDSALFGAVLRTYISKDGVEWLSDVCVFDGVENVRERCANWFGEHLTEKAIAELRIEDEMEQKKAAAVGGIGKQRAEPDTTLGDAPPNKPVELPPDLNIFESEPIVDRKSLFIGRACRIDDPSQVNTVLSFLLSDRRTAKATHPIINAWRCRVGDVLHQDNDDDGETAAGGRLAHLLQILDLDNVLVVVTRFYGGIQLGPDRFKHINHVARKALEVGGFLDAPESSSGRKAHSRNKKHG